VYFIVYGVYFRDGHYRRCFPENTWNYMSNKITKSGFTKDQLLNEDVLAYCGYKLEGNKLVPTYYEPNPYTPIGVVKERIKQFEKSKK